MSDRLRVAVVGAAGYSGGELLRLLLSHPHTDVVAATSERLCGQYVHHTHPVLRQRSQLRFIDREHLPDCDVLMAALPHGESSLLIDELGARAPLVVDLSADFRLRDGDTYLRWYGREHPRPDLLGSAVYALPELDRSRIRGAALLAAGGCVATAAILALRPLAVAGLVDTTQAVVVDAKVGSSAAGARPGASSHHPHRSGTMRSFAPTGHRHTAEIVQETGLRNVALSVTAVEAVRGVLITAHVAVADAGVDDRALRSVYRQAYASEAFVRVVKNSRGIHRHPEPKILAGTNICDIGFERDPHSSRVVVLAAIDNLMKGAAGQAVHAMNVHAGLDECAGLDFSGLYPDMTAAPLVIKVGGSIDEPAGLLDDIAAQPGPLVIVHGGHRVLDSLAVQLGHPPRVVTSSLGATSRYTDATSMDHFLMAYCGQVNKRLVQGLLRRGVRAVGMAAMDGGMVRGRRRPDIRVREHGRTVVLHGDHAGSIVSVDRTVMISLIGAGCTPVVCPPAWGDDGVPINVDGDRLTAEIAVALGAERVVIFSDTAGFLADPDDPASVVRSATLRDIDGLLSSARGRARTKIAAVHRALTGGVGAVGLCDGTSKRPLRDALDGMGSWFVVAGERPRTLADAAAPATTL